MILSLKLGALVENEQGRLVDDDCEQVYAELDTATGVMLDLFHEPSCVSLLPDLAIDDWQHDRLRTIRPLVELVLADELEGGSSWLQAAPTGVRSTAHAFLSCGPPSRGDARDLDTWRLEASDANAQLHQLLQERPGLVSELRESPTKSVELPPSREWDQSAERSYRELQALWHEAQDAERREEFGLARRLFEVALDKARSPAYSIANPSERIRQLSRDLGKLHARLGEYERAVELLLDAGRDVDAATCLLARGRAEAAAAMATTATADSTLPRVFAWLRVLFVARKHSDVLKLSPRLSHLGAWNLEILAAALHAVVEQSGGDCESLLPRQAGNARRALLDKYGDWPDVLAAGERVMARGRGRHMSKYLDLPRREHGDWQYDKHALAQAIARCTADADATAAGYRPTTLGF